jgi:tetratricopeptide (TPR) repeat protein
MDKYKEKLIDNFLFEKLTDNEQIEFDKLLEEDAEFKEEVNLMRHVVTGLEKRGECAALKEIQTLTSKKEFEKILLKAKRAHRKKSRRVLFSLITIGVAAAMLIFIYIGMQPAYSTDSLCKEYYETTLYENIPVRDGGLLSNEQLSLKAEATELYKEGQYAQALELYNQLKVEIDSKDIPEDILFYSAICLIEGGRYDDAIERLKRLYDEGVYFSDKAGWNLALCYLIKRDREDAKHILTKLIEEKTEYEIKGNELLSKINKKKLF